MQQKNAEYEGSFTSFIHIFMYIAIEVFIELEIYVNNKTILTTREKKERKKVLCNVFPSSPSQSIPSKEI